MSALIHYQVDNQLALIGLSHAPVNALSQALRAELLQAFEQAAADPAVHAIIVHGQVLASGTLDEVRGAATLEERFVELAGGRKAAEGMEWLHSFSD